MELLRWKEPAPHPELGMNIVLVKMTAKKPVQVRVTTMG